MATSASGSPRASSDAKPRRGLLIEFLFAREEGPSHPVERVVAAAAVSGLFGLDPSPHRVEGAIGE